VGVLVGVEPFILKTMFQSDVGQDLYSAGLYTKHQYGTPYSEIVSVPFQLDWL